MKTKIDRRTLLKRFGSTSLAGLAGLSLSACNQAQTNEPKETPTPNCILTPEQIEGPFYFNPDRVRSDITEGRPGTPLELSLTVVSSKSGSCTVIPNAIVDIWHADKTGTYSGYEEEGTAGERFLRGVQVTDKDGKVKFQTIYPGWYEGRTTHIHFKIHLNDKELVTSQLYFPDGINQAVYSSAEYAARGQADTDNKTDFIANDGNLSKLLMAVKANGAGYQASHTIGIKS